MRTLIDLRQCVGVELRWEMTRLVPPAWTVRCQKAEAAMLAWKDPLARKVVGRTASDT